MHLQRAQQGVQQAEVLIEDDENERAEMVLQRAEADADLALAMAQEESAKKEAQRALEQLEELRKKLKEKTP
jgi:N-acetylmuramic acid 6-phosphate (MurNAc-6-P) etherase